MPHQVSTILVNPSMIEVKEALDAIIKLANKRAKVRKIEQPTQEIYQFYLETLEGYWWTHGGSISPEFSKSTISVTSVLGIAWWSDSSGNKHVRLTGGRIEVTETGHAPLVFGKNCPSNYLKVYSGGKMVNLLEAMEPILN